MLLVWSNSLFEYLSIFNYLLIYFKHFVIQAAMSSNIIGAIGFIQCHIKLYLGWAMGLKHMSVQTITGDQ